MPTRPTNFRELHAAFGRETWKRRQEREREKEKSRRRRRRRRKRFIFPGKRCACLLCGCAIREDGKFVQLEGGKGKLERGGCGT